MDETLKKTTGGLAMALALGGCGAGEMETRKETVTDPVQVETSINDSLARLQALELVDAGRLVMRLPAEATACYLYPCPSWKALIDEERARQAPRLASLVEIAAAKMATADLAPRPSSDADAAVRALAALEIVEIRALVQRQPASNPYCYNLPCQVDIEAAERENGRRVAAAFATAEAARGSGL
jgi:hypothetical protein